jgi:hypothetical protein
MFINSENLELAQLYNIAYTMILCEFSEGHAIIRGIIYLFRK